MTPSEIGATLAALDKLFPDNTWTDEIRAAVAVRLKPFDLSLEQAKAVITEYRMGTRWRSPVPKDLLDLLRAASNSAHRQKNAITAPGDRPQWHIFRAALGLQPHVGMVEVLTLWHGGVFDRRLAAAVDATWARHSAWCGLACELVREGVPWPEAASHATQAFGAPAAHIEMFAARRCGLNLETAHASSPSPAPSLAATSER